ncbi:hypothetical protein CDL15_Pgr006012 [Punica granatum]|uniref:Uncharacterized protein n=1 Tax=Punica granatum TaxID=22663 RepID=A0A218VUK2_PUNGR|nr:hypothetical protein CDL15_Pgr006012 [Punica granatum]
MYRQFVVVPPVTAAFIASTIVSAIAEVVAATTVLAATSVSVATTARGLGLVDGDALAIEILAIHPFDGIPHGLLVDEGDESEAMGPLGLRSVDDLRV